MQDAYLAAVNQEIEAVVGEKIALEVEFGILQQSSNRQQQPASVISSSSTHVTPTSTSADPSAAGLAPSAPLLRLPADMLEAMVCMYVYCMLYVLRM